MRPVLFVALVAGVVSSTLLFTACGGATTPPGGQRGDDVGSSETPTTPAACVSAGKVSSSKLFTGDCCPGLVRIDQTWPDDAGTCVRTAVDTPICAACGDGVCDRDRGENPCNCTADCQAPAP